MPETTKPEQTDTVAQLTAQVASLNAQLLAQTGRIESYLHALAARDTKITELVNETAAHLDTIKARDAAIATLTASQNSFDMRLATELAKQGVRSCAVSQPKGSIETEKAPSLTDACLAWRAANKNYVPPSVG